MHRIKNIEGVVNEYYVIPGGGIEDGEDIESATKRELKEEIGIDVKLINSEPIFTLKEENKIQYFSIINKISGKIGTGTGPEFSDLSYSNKGVYSAEMIQIQDIIDGKINMVPIEIKNLFIDTIKNLNKKICNINSEDLKNIKNIMISII